MQRNENTGKPPSTPDREQQYDDFVVLLAGNDIALRRYVRSLLPSRDGVEDVIQETALECWKKFSDFTPADKESAEDEFIRWACVIARFKVLSWQRDKSRERLVFRENVIELLSQEAMDALDQYETEQLAMEACLAKLPDDQRRLVLSVHSPGDSIAAIAEKTGVKARKLYSKVNHLRSLLLECVQRQLAGGTVHG